MSALLTRLLDRDPHRCVWCGERPRGRRGSWTVEHLLPRSRKGSSNEANLALACEPCNSARRSTPAASFFRARAQARQVVPASDDLRRALARLAEDGTPVEQAYARRQGKLLADWQQQYDRWGMY